MPHRAQAQEAGGDASAEGEAGLDSSGLHQEGWQGPTASAGGLAPPPPPAPRPAAPARRQKRPLPCSPAHHLNSSYLNELAPASHMARGPGSGPPSAAGLQGRLAAAAAAGPGAGMGPEWLLSVKQEFEDAPCLQLEGRHHLQQQQQQHARQQAGPGPSGRPTSAPQLGPADCVAGPAGIRAWPPVADHCLGEGPRPGHSGGFRQEPAAAATAAPGPGATSGPYAGLFSFLGDRGVESRLKSLLAASAAGLPPQSPPGDLPAGPGPQDAGAGAQGPGFSHPGGGGAGGTLVCWPPSCQQAPPGGGALDRRQQRQQQQQQQEADARGLAEPARGGGGLQHGEMFSPGLSPIITAQQVNAARPTRLLQSLYSQQRRGGGGPQQPGGGGPQQLVSPRSGRADHVPAAQQQLLQHQQHQHQHQHQHQLLQHQQHQQHQIARQLAQERQLAEDQLQREQQREQHQPGAHQLLQSMAMSPLPSARAPQEPCALGAPWASPIDLDHQMQLPMCNVAQQLPHNPEAAQPQQWRWQPRRDLSPSSAEPPARAAKPQQHAQQQQPLARRALESSLEDQAPHSSGPRSAAATPVGACAAAAGAASAPPSSMCATAGPATAFAGRGPHHAHAHPHGALHHQPHAHQLAHALGGAHPHQHPQLACGSDTHVATPLTVGSSGSGCDTGFPRPLACGTPLAARLLPGAPQWHMHLHMHMHADCSSQSPLSQLMELGRELQASGGDIADAVWEELAGDGGAAAWAQPLAPQQGVQHAQGVHGAQGMHAHLQQQEQQHRAHLGGLGMAAAPVVDFATVLGHVQGR